MTFRPRSWRISNRSALHIERSGEPSRDSGAVARLASPYSKGAPTQNRKRGLRCAVPLGVLGYLLAPKLSAGRGQRRAAAASVSMPEAAVNEDSEPVARQHDIGRPRQHAVVQSESEASVVQYAAHGQLRGGVSCPHSRHFRTFALRRAGARFGWSRPISARQIAARFASAAIQLDAFQTPGGIKF